MSFEMPFKFMTRRAVGDSKLFCYSSDTSAFFRSYNDSTLYKVVQMLTKRLSISYITVLCRIQIVETNNKNKITLTEMLSLKRTCIYTFRAQPLYVIKFMCAYSTSVSNLVRFPKWIFGNFFLFIPLLY